MIDKSKLTEEMVINKLCNVLINSQELIEDLEDLEEANLFKQELKQNAKRLFVLLEKYVGDVMGSNPDTDMVAMYEELMASRRDYRQLSLEDRIRVNTVLKIMRKEADDDICHGCGNALPKESALCYCKDCM